METKWQRKDGSVIEVLLSSAPLAGDSLSSGVTFTALDITEQKMAAEALGKSEAKFRSYIELSPLAVFVADREGRLIDFNPAAKDLLGHDATVLRNMNITDLHPEEDREEVLSVFAALLETGHVQTERQMKKRDGQRIWVSLNAGMISDRLSLGYCQDITERKRAEKALCDSEEQFKAMFEMASIGMAQADPKTGQLLRVNQKMCEITGYSPGELLTMRIPEITHPDDRERDWEAFQNVVNGKSKNYRIEKRYICKDGTIGVGQCEYDGHP